jgi:guanyl-specific ribonuclease Sa
MKRFAVLAVLALLLLGGCESQQVGSGEEHAAIAAVLADIDAGRPLPNGQDGQTFQNREGHLPQQPGGYYREYTVPTPGSSDRGTRRLVIGRAGETYYTHDHYTSFEHIDPGDYR